jgi:elongation factor 1-beta
VDLDKLSEDIISKIKEFAGECETKVEKEAIGFGLSALKILFTMDEAKGDIDPLEEKVKQIEGVNSVEVIDVRRAIG